MQLKRYFLLFFTLSLLAMGQEGSAGLKGMLPKNPKVIRALKIGGGITGSITLIMGVAYLFGQYRRSQLLQKGLQYYCPSFPEKVQRNLRASKSLLDKLNEPYDSLVKTESWTCNLM